MISAVLTVKMVLYVHRNLRLIKDGEKGVGGRVEMNSSSARSDP